MNEATSASSALLLMARGYKNVYAVKGGWRAWELAKYPVEPNGNK
jgi:rhodanese-related sulfurtransferase